MARPKNILNIFKPDKFVGKHNPAKAGAVGFDNVRQNIDPHIVTQKVSTKAIVGSSAEISGVISGSGLVIDNTISGSNLVITNDISGSTLTISGGELVKAENNTLNIKDGKVYVDDTGNVGIGTTTPDGTLHIETGTNARALEITGSNDPYIRISDTEGSNFTLQSIDNAFRIYDVTDGAERLRIDTSGNVGIGTTSPSGILHVVGDFVNISGSTNFGQLRVGGSGSPGIRLITNSGTVATRSWAIAPNVGTNGDLSFMVSDTNTGEPLTTNNLMVIQSSGNVGIGTTSPEKTLHVKGGAAVLGKFERSSAGDSSILLNNTEAEWNFGIDRSDSNAFKLASSAGLGSDVVMTLETGGNVGIGTTSPNTKLEVNGTISGSAVIVANGANFSGAVTNITVVDGIVTAVS